MADSTVPADGVGSKQPTREASGGSSETGKRDGIQGPDKSNPRREKSANPKFRFPRQQNTEGDSHGSQGDRDAGAADGQASRGSPKPKSKATKQNWQQRWQQKQWHGKPSSSYGSNPRYGDDERDALGHPEEGNQKPGKGYPHKHQRQQYRRHKNSSASDDSRGASKDGASSSSSLSMSSTPAESNNTSTAQPPNGSDQLQATATASMPPSSGHDKQAPFYPGKSENRGNRRRIDGRKYRDQSNEWASPQYNKDGRYERRGETQQYNKDGRYERRGETQQYNKDGRYERRGEAASATSVGRSHQYSQDGGYERTGETTSASIGSNQQKAKKQQKKAAFTLPATFSQERLEHGGALHGKEQELGGKTADIDQYRSSGAKPKQSASSRQDARNSRHNYNSNPVESWEAAKLKDTEEKTEGRAHSLLTLDEVISQQNRLANTKAQRRQQQQQRVFKVTREKQKTTENQMSTLIEHLSNGSYECMVCCEVVKQQHAIWSCLECYAVFHIHCIKKWARSPVAAVSENENGWRCPACQNVVYNVPNIYKCFCGRLREPQWKPGETPHSCGELCQRPRKDTQCTHSCNILCHPGPCPPCPVNVTKTCDCGKSKLTMRCGQPSTVHCEQVCQKTLNCGLHFCQSPCHGGPCVKCNHPIKQECYCGKASRQVVCGTSEAFESRDGYYCCQEPCGKVLSCGNHSCEGACHPGPCGDCPYRPERVTHCPCGQTPLAQLAQAGGRRTACTDPVPTCKLTCSKPLGCGSPEAPHLCQLACHAGTCPPCTGTTTVPCRCKLNDLELSCAELAGGKKKVPLCTRKCNKKKSCGKHKCTQTCCIEEEHKCTSLCRKKLNCGLHRCEDRCHPGNCSRCLQSSFDELTCHCGASVLYPPVACGTPPPSCHQPCARPRDCQHPVSHTCHREEACPPCTVLTQRLCLGGHELRSNIACHIKEISCGRPCGKPLTCGDHKCQLTCHKGECMSGKQRCKQPCTKLRQDCGHPCHAPCHPSAKKCPKLPCKQLITVSCKCGNRTEKVQCLMGGSADYMAATYQRLSTSALASQMNAVQSGQTVDISHLVKSNQAHASKRELECNEECAIRERNRRLAEALDLVNPDLSSQLPPKEYTPFLKDYAQQNPAFVASVEKDLIALIESLQKNAKQMRKTYLFPTMKRDRRHVVHELAEFYNCETEGVDPEPNRSVLVTASRAKSSVPSQTLTSAMRREANPPPPPPIPHHGSVGALRSSIRAAKQSTLLKDQPPIDYFDLTNF